MLMLIFDGLIYFLTYLYSVPLINYGFPLLGMTVTNFYWLPMVFVEIFVQIGLELKNHPGLQNFLHILSPACDLFHALFYLLLCMFSQAPAIWITMQISGCSSLQSSSFFLPYTESSSHSRSPPRWYLPP